MRNLIWSSMSPGGRKYPGAMISALTISVPTSRTSQSNALRDRNLIIVTLFLTLQKLIFFEWYNTFDPLDRDIILQTVQTKIRWTIRSRLIWIHTVNIEIKHGFFMH